MWNYHWNSNGIKGHNFPKIALVLILGSDNALFSSDYRATEKLMQELFQLLVEQEENLILTQRL